MEGGEEEAHRPEIIIASTISVRGDIVFFLFQTFSRFLLFILPTLIHMIWSVVFPFLFKMFFLIVTNFIYDVLHKSFFEKIGVVSLWDSPYEMKV